MCASVLGGNRFRVMYLICQVICTDCWTTTNAFSGARSKGLEADEPSTRAEEVLALSGRVSSEITGGWKFV
jgi:hypothetical protein